MTKPTDTQPADLAGEVFPLAACPKGLADAIFMAEKHGYDLHIGLDKIEVYANALRSTPEPVAQAVREETVARAIHTYCSRNMVMTYLDAEEDCEGLAKAIVAALADAGATPNEMPSAAARLPRQSDNGDKDRVLPVEAPATPAALDARPVDDGVITPAPDSPKPDTYRGWAVTWDYGHFTATSPDYDASWEGEEDGWVDNGLRTTARTRADLEAEVDAILDDQVQFAALARPADGVVGECERLFGLLDDIDAADDITKSNHSYYRDLVRNLAKKRFDGGITTDGFTLNLAALARPADGATPAAMDVERVALIERLRNDPVDRALAYAAADLLERTMPLPATGEAPSDGGEG